MSNYKTKLAKEIHLDVNRWEVGLAEIVYPISWHNVMNANFKVRKLIDSKWVWLEGSIPDNRYEDVVQLLRVLKDEVERIMNDQFHAIAFSLLTNRHVKVFIEDGYGLQMSKSLVEILGFGDSNDCTLTTFGSENCDFISENKSIYSPFIADVHRGLRTLFVHCNIIQSQLVGDQYVPLLRTIAVRGETDSVVAEPFTNIHYMNVERATFQEIEIHITDETGKNIPFQYGRVIVLLHFKRK